MSNIQHDLVPDVGRLVIQTGIFLATVVVANYYLIQPALRLHNERKKRTSGAIGEAKSFEQRAESLEISYQQQLKQRIEEARGIRQSEVDAGQKQAEDILKAAQQKTEHHLLDVRTELQKNVSEEKKKLNALVGQVADAILGKLGVVNVITFCILSGLGAQIAFAEEAGHAAVGFNVMDGIVWPYYQFAIYLAIVFFMGRKIIPSILSNRRDALRVKLTESKQALVLAQKRAAEFETKMASLQKEVDDLRNQYAQDGARERSKIISEAQAVAQQMTMDAARTAKELVARSKEDLRRQLVEMAIEAVEARLTPDVAKNLDKKLNAEALQGLRGMSLPS